MSTRSTRQLHSGGAQHTPRLQPINLKHARARCPRDLAALPSDEAELSPTPSVSEKMEISGFKVRLA
jgi:hypothetical protein